jgi:hypothetical protein
VRIGAAQADRAGVGAVRHPSHSDRRRRLRVRPLRPPQHVAARDQPSIARVNVGEFLDEQRAEQLPSVSVPSPSSRWERAESSDRRTPPSQDAVDARVPEGMGRGERRTAGARSIAAARWSLRTHPPAGSESGRDVRRQITMSRRPSPRARPTAPGAPGVTPTGHLPRGRHGRNAAEQRDEQRCAASPEEIDRCATPGTGLVPIRRHIRSPAQSGSPA